ncbi:myosin-G heavy chain-like [Teleopsis dalmanni]|uniref:myosin-G heavy chain-like n=1 Tax=Teleopsis dalmanni TaxID=139649 RepID=UPI0018CDD144|nr:myosin-G heavy chain-like [Teleopsis dalmanni]
MSDDINKTAAATTTTTVTTDITTTNSEVIAATSEVPLSNVNATTCTVTAFAELSLFDQLKNSVNHNLINSKTGNNSIQPNSNNNNGTGGSNNSTGGSNIKTEISCSISQALHIPTNDTADNSSSTNRHLTKEDKNCNNNETDTKLQQQQQQSETDLAILTAAKEVTDNNKSRTNEKSTKVCSEKCSFMKEPKVKNTDKVLTKIENSKKGNIKDVVSATSISAHNASNTSNNNNINNSDNNGSKVSNNTLNLIRKGEQVTNLTTLLSKTDTLVKTAAATAITATATEIAIATILPEVVANPNISVMQTDKQQTFLSNANNQEMSTTAIQLMSQSNATIPTTNTIQNIVNTTATATATDIVCSNSNKLKPIPIPTLTASTTTTNVNFLDTHNTANHCANQVVGNSNESVEIASNNIASIAAVSNTNQHIKTTVNTVNTAAPVAAAATTINALQNKTSNLNQQFSTPALPPPTTTITAIGNISSNGTSIGIVHGMKRATSATTTATALIASKPTSAINIAGKFQAPTVNSVAFLQQQQQQQNTHIFGIPQANVVANSHSDINDKTSTMTSNNTTNNIVNIHRMENNKVLRSQRHYHHHQQHLLQQLHHHNHHTAIANSNKRTAATAGSHHANESDIISKKKRCTDRYDSSESSDS